MEMLVHNTLDARIAVLTEGAKYDVSCSSSGGTRGSKKGYLGDTAPAGICHSFAADGRCISLLKILLSNKCEYNCLYCVNRRTSNIPRARLEPEELAALVIGFYRRNYIEGLFLSSAVEVSPNYSMERLIKTMELLRFQYKFRGYIHLKGIPGAEPAMLERAARLADRMSVNIELPTETSLKLLAPQKKKEAILLPMQQLAGLYLDEKERENPRAKKHIPAGQTTQMVIGATPDTDGQIVRLSEGLYRKFGLKRVYYSAYIPANENSLLPALPPNLKRENRLYQADWLLRFYGFQAEELLPQNHNLAMDVDPKADWALRHLGAFPLEINTAPYEMLLRVPGIGVKNAFRIAEARRYTKLTYDDLKRLRVALPRARHFITVGGKYYGIRQDDPQLIRLYLTDSVPKLGAPKTEAEQLSFFDASRLTGEF